MIFSEFGELFHFQQTVVVWGGVICKSPCFRLQQKTKAESPTLESPTEERKADLLRAESAGISRRLPSGSANAPRRDARASATMTRSAVNIQTLSCRRRSSAEGLQPLKGGSTEY